MMGRSTMEAYGASIVLETSVQRQETGKGSWMFKDPTGMSAHLINGLVMVYSTDPTTL